MYEVPISNSFASSARFLTELLTVLGVFNSVLGHFLLALKLKISFLHLFTS